MNSFKSWKKWFLSEVASEILEFNEISLSENMPIQKIGIPRGNELRKVHKRQVQFIESFRLLCMKYGLDPAAKINMNNFDLDDGLKIWRPDPGLLSDKFSKYCYSFYKLQTDNNVQFRNKNNFIQQTIERKRSRLTKRIAVPIIYYLESHKGNKVALTILREYFSERFLKDLEQIKRGIRRIIRNYNKKYSDDFPSKELDIPKQLIKLAVSRGETNINRWRAVWIYDLYRCALSENHVHLKKAISTAQKSKLTIEVIKLGLVNTDKR